MRRITASRTAAGNRRGEGRPRLRWARAGAPPSSKRRFSRRTRRTLIPRATATCPFVTRPAQAALSNPGRCSSFRLNVKVSMGGGLFHVAVRGGHFHVAAALRFNKLEHTASVDYGGAMRGRTSNKRIGSSDEPLDRKP